MESYLIHGCERKLRKVSFASVLHALPPVCSDTHRMNCSLGTTMRFPIFSVGNPSSCINSYPLLGDTPNTFATVSAFRNSGSSS